MAWVDDLIPPGTEQLPILSRICSTQITDAGTLVYLGAVDQSCAGLAYQLLQTQPGTGLVVQFPRGRHELAVLLGCVVQLMRLARRVTSDAASTSFDGPVVIIGTDTLVHERLARIRIANQPSHLALLAGRIRSDGRIVASDGELHENVPDGLLYLNTRVGWPRLLRGLNAGVVIIDRSTFSSPSILDRALAWAHEHRARHVIVVAEIGDENTIEQTKSALDQQLCVWPWTAVRPSSTYIEDTSARIRVALGIAARLQREFPPSLQTARRLFYGLIQLTGHVETYNLHASLDHRTSALSSLRHRIESERDPRVEAEWSTYYMSRWTDLRLDLLDLYRLIEQDNPKLLGVALAIEWLRDKHSTAPICIRVSSEAAGMALADDMEELVPEWPIDGKSITWRSWSERLEWNADERFETLPASPPPSRAGLLWSVEASQQMLVLYDFELASVTRRVEHSNELSIERLNHCCDRLGLGSLPPLTASAKIDEVINFDPGSRERPGVDLDVDLDVMFFDPEDDTGASSEHSAAEVDPATVIPIVLEPDGSRWLIRHDAQVETLKAQRVVYLPVDSVKPGMTVVVPQGDGREELFARLVTATHQSQDLQAFDVLFVRWRDACRTAYRDAGSWEVLGQRMHAEGCLVTSQSPRTWATGEVIGPEDPEDIRRIGKLAGDPLVERQYRRIDAAVRQVRSLHMRLGSLLNAAMTDAISGGVSTWRNSSSFSEASTHRNCLTNLSCASFALLTNPKKSLGI